MKKILISILITAAIPTTLFAHSGHEQPGGMGVVSKAYLESSIAVLDGVGTNETIALTSSLPAGNQRALALTYTRQGIALHHAFQWEDSVRSFKEALRLDPDMARAHLGITTSYLNLAGPNDDLSFVAHNLELAATAAAKVQNNEVDRLWVDVMAVYFPARYGITANVAPVSGVGKTLTGNDINTNLNALLNALLAMNDAEAYAFVGWDLQSYQELMAAGPRFPEHTGIWHYLTHIYENSGRYAEAASAAETVIKFAPNAPHLLHMYGHVLPFLGQWDKANEYFLRAHCIHSAVLRINEPLCSNIKVDAPVSTVTPGTKELWHYAHNLELYGFSLMRTRDLPTAENMFVKLCDISACTSLLQFYLGEGFYDKALHTVAAKGPSADLMQMEVQALLGQGKVQEAQMLFQNSSPTGLEGLASALGVAWATNTISAPLKTQLTKVLAQATASPNFDTWSHLLPVLRKLNRFATQYNAAEQQEIFNAIQKIDAGHPF